MSLWFLALLLVLSAGIAIGLMLVVRRHSPATGFFTHPTRMAGLAVMLVAGLSAISN